MALYGMVTAPFDTQEGQKFPVARGSSFNINLHIKAVSVKVIIFDARGATQKTIFLGDTASSQLSGNATKRKPPREFSSRKLPSTNVQMRRRAAIEYIPPLEPTIVGEDLKSTSQYQKRDIKAPEKGPRGQGAYLPSRGGWVKQSTPQTQVEGLDIIQPGTYSFIWDGTDDLGNRVADGEYFAAVYVEPIDRPKESHNVLSTPMSQVAGLTYTDDLIRKGLSHEDAARVTGDKVPIEVMGVPTHNIADCALWKVRNELIGIHQAYRECAALNLEQQAQGQTAQTTRKEDDNSLSLLLIGGAALALFQI